MVTVSALTYQYENGQPLVFPDFFLGKGETCLLLGNSGSGKTTLLHLMGGLLKIQQGKVVVADEDISLLSPTQMDRFRGRHVGFIFQRNHLIRALSVRQNLLMARYLADLEQDEKRIDEVLAQLGLWDRRNERVSRLSQGQAQRVAIARAILNKPALLLADEPTSALDDFNCDRVIRLLVSIAEQNQCTLVVATHDQRLKAVIQRQVSLRNHDQSVQ